MSFTAEYVDDGRGVLYVGSGTLTAPEIVAVKRELLADPDRARRLRFALVSLDEVTSFPTPEEIRQTILLAHELARINRHAVIGIVASLDLPFGMARMWEALAFATGWAVSVFRDRTQAEEWVRATVAARAHLNPET